MNPNVPTEIREWVENIQIRTGLSEGDIMRLYAVCSIRCLPEDKIVCALNDLRLKWTKKNPQMPSTTLNCFLEKKIRYDYEKWWNESRWNRIKRKCWLLITRKPQERGYMFRLKYPPKNPQYTPSLRCPQWAIDILRDIFKEEK